MHGVAPTQLCGCEVETVNAAGNDMGPLNNHGGVAPTQLCGCEVETVNAAGNDMGPLNNHGADLVDYGSGGIHLVLASKICPPSALPVKELAVQADTAEPEVHEELPLEGMLLLTLRRINGRLQRDQTRGKQ